jgi:hypothetical protein
MAFGTIGSARTFVFIVTRMAGNASHARFFNPAIRAMTLLASNRAVLSG